MNAICWHRLQSFTRDQILLQTPSDRRFEDVPEQVAFAVFAVAILREGRVVRHLCIEAETTEPAVSKAFDADASRISAVVTDIRLGAGPNGWDIGHHVREAIPAMPLVYMSGDSSHEWEAHRVSHSVMVPKPFVHAQIITALATLMNNPDLG